MINYYLCWRCFHDGSLRVAGRSACSPYHYWSRMAAGPVLVPFTGSNKYVLCLPALPARASKSAKWQPRLTNSRIKMFCMTSNDASYRPRGGFENWDWLRVVCQSDVCPMPTMRLANHSETIYHVFFQHPSTLVANTYVRTQHLFIAPWTLFLASYETKA